MERCNQTALYFRSKHDTKKLHVRVELRPQDMNQGVNMWKSVVAEQNGPPLTAEEDREEVDMDPVFSRVQSQEPEQDWDEVYHKHSEELLQYLTPLGADSKSDAEVRVAYSEPEKDEDDMYHGDNQYSEVQTESEQKIKEDSAVRLYLQPEEDKDDLYHKHVEQLLFQSEPKAAAPIDVPSQRKHSEAEEDLDDLYHQWSLKKQTSLEGQNENERKLNLKGYTRWTNQRGPSRSLWNETAADLV